jgi:DNA adenine methylase
MRAFLKWAGGKSRLVCYIRRWLPPGARLIEPFVGSGAVFLNTNYSAYLLGDVNKDLIYVFRQIQEHGDDFIEECATLFRPETNTASAYYALRDEFNSTTDLTRRAVLFVYLNRHGYNGLCRYNAQGQFNVPFGRYRQPYFPVNEMRAFADKAQQAQFIAADFRTVLSLAQPGDVVYCDPPYVPLSATATFTNYAAGGFSLADQIELAEQAAMLADRGIPVLISNHATPLTVSLYAKAHVDTVQVGRSISCDGTRRGYVSEVLAFFGDVAK